MNKGPLNALELLPRHQSAKKNGVIGQMMKGLGQLREVRNVFPVKNHAIEKTLKGPCELRSRTLC
jgi:hypothetical protein